jgi:UDP-N-acetylmuramoylalanine--D-glutamate ligase
MGAAGAQHFEIAMSSYEGKKVLVVGLGESGKAAVRFFGSRGAHVTITDSRSVEEFEGVIESFREWDVELRLGDQSRDVFLKQDLIVPSPGVPWDLSQLNSARKEGIHVAGELETASRELRGHVVGITGTNGKTTTTSLIGHIFQTAGLPTQIAGNIGRPILDVADSATDATWNVLELSSFQLEAMSSFRADIAVVLNVTPDHLDRHGTFENYAAAKANLLAPQQVSDVAVLNADDATCKVFGQSACARTIWFSRTQPLSEGITVDRGWILRDGERVASTALPILGSHNLENALAAVGAASAAGVADETIARGLATFQPVEHRLEFVKRVDGVDYYNDSKATNVAAAIKALESFDKRVWLILGGRDKGSDYAALEPMMDGRVKEVLLIGEATSEIRLQLTGPTPMVNCGTLEVAVERAHSRAREGDVVLLSPACASFDQFDSYGHRGQEFKRLVGEFARVEVQH